MAEIITSAVELDALPEDDVLLLASGRYRYMDGTFTECWVRPVPSWITGSPARSWEVLVHGGEMPQGMIRTEDITLPVTVLYRPDAPTDAARPGADREALVTVLADALTHHVRAVLDTTSAGLPSDASLRERSGVAADCEQRLVSGLRHGGALDAFAFDVVIARVLAAQPTTPAPVDGDAVDGEHVECDCAPSLGPSHCHPCSERQEREVPWFEAHPATQSAAERISDLEDEVASLREQIRVRRSHARDHAIAHHGAAPWTDAERAEGLVPPFEHQHGRACRTADAPSVTGEQVQTLASESGRPERVVRDWLRTAGITVEGGAERG